MPKGMTDNDKEELEEQDLEPEEGSNNLPESPASANMVCWIDGFRTQFTVRDEQVKEVVKRIEYLINEYAKKKGWKPTWKEEPEDKPETPREEPKKEVRRASEKQLKYLADLMGRTRNEEFDKEYADKPAWEVSKLIKQYQK